MVRVVVDLRTLREHAEQLRTDKNPASLLSTAPVCLLGQIMELKIHKHLEVPLSTVKSIIKFYTVAVGRLR